jgi:hypothetical protein
LDTTGKGSFQWRQHDETRHITSPQEWQYLLLGVNVRPGGYTEEDYVASEGMDLVTAFRTWLYDARGILPSNGSWCYLSVDDYHGHSIKASESDTRTYEHALRAMFGYGH